MLTELGIPGGKPLFKTLKEYQDFYWKFVDEMAAYEEKERERLLGLQKPA